MIFREILLEDYRTLFQKIVGTYQDPEKILERFYVFWEILLDSVRKNNFKELEWPDKINPSTTSGSVFADIIKFGGSKQNRVLQIKVKEFFVFLTDASFRVHGDLYFQGSAKAGGMLLANCPIDSNSSALVLHLNNRKSHVIHEFTHLVQNTFKFDNWHSYEDRGKEHEAFMVEFTEPYYAALKALKNGKVPNNSFFTSGTYLDFCKEILNKHPGTLETVFLSLVKHGKMQRAYKYFGIAFKKHGGKPVDTNEKISAVSSEMFSSYKKTGSIF
jgi:hypothetical protein